MSGVLASGFRRKGNSIADISNTDVATLDFRTGLFQTTGGFEAQCRPAPRM
jgi:hypothetical protein